MAIVKFSVGDILRSKLLDPGWRSWQITKVDEPRPSEDKNALNYDITFVLIDATPDLNGKEIKRTFSSKAMGMMIPLVQAVRGQKAAEVKIESFEFDMQELLNKKIDGFCKVDVYMGNSNNKVEEYAPYKTLSLTGGNPFNG